MQTFLATVDRAGVSVPAHVVEALGPEREPRVWAMVAGHAFASRIVLRGGVYRLPIGARHGVAPGDAVSVTVELDAEPRAVPVPDDLLAALEAAPAARRAFDALSASARTWFVASVDGAGRAAVRRAVAALA